MPLLKKNFSKEDLRALFKEVKVIFELQKTKNLLLKDKLKGNKKYMVDNIISMEVELQKLGYF